jgi:hypothetical protein
VSVKLGKDELYQAQGGWENLSFAERINPYIEKRTLADNGVFFLYITLSPGIDIRNPCVQYFSYEKSNHIS